MNIPFIYKFVLVTRKKANFKDKEKETGTKKAVHMIKENKEHKTLRSKNKVQSSVSSCSSEEECEYTL